MLEDYCWEIDTKGLMLRDLCWRTGAAD